MLRPILLASLALVPLASEQVSFHANPLTPRCVNSIAHEPLVLFEATGGTLAGPYDLELVVYADGNVRLSSTVQGGGKAASAVIDPAQALGFAMRLERAGSFRSCDRPQEATDLPLSTLTVMHGDTDSASHTFSWWVPDGSSQGIDAQIQAFVAEVFPEF